MYTDRMARPKTPQEFITAAPKDAQKKLREIRALLKKAAPGSIEALKWGVPTFAYKRILFAYGNIKGNISFMPTPPVLRAFKKDLTKYSTSPATVKFPLDKPLPKGLITRMARYRVKESKEKDVRWM